MIMPAACVRQVDLESRPARRRPLGAAAARLALAGFLFCAGTAAAAAAVDTPEERARVHAAQRYRLDVDLQYDHLTPNELYGDWHSLWLTFTVKSLPRFTPFLWTGLYEREDWIGAGGAGAYMDWLPSLYTYTSFGVSGASEFHTRWRLDHFFNLKTGRLTWAAGGGLMEDHRDHRDWFLAAGPRYWHGPLILEYRLTRYASDPGDHISWQHLWSFGHGREGRRWLFMNLTHGGQKYLATWVDPSQTVDYYAWEIGAVWQQWLTDRAGFKLRAGFLDLGERSDGYRKVSLGVGGFWDF